MESMATMQGTNYQKNHDHDTTTVAANEGARAQYQKQFKVIKQFEVSSARLARLDNRRGAHDLVHPQQPLARGSLFCRCLFA
jgi:hypothetical protein